MIAEPDSVGRADVAAGPGTAYCGPTATILHAHASMDAGVEQDVARRHVDAEQLRAVTRSWTDAAIVVVGPDGIELAIRGRVDAAVGDTSVPGTATWQTHRFTISEPTPVTLSLGEPSDWQGVCDGGAVPAGGVRRIVTPTSGPDAVDAWFGPTVTRSVEGAAVRTDTGPPPPVGVLVFSSGERVLVDRPMVIGRNPEIPASHPGQRPPRLVRVSGAGVSRQHAVVSVDRWHAAIADLGSANGTSVAVPGRARVPVAPGVPVDLVAGAVVDLGGEVSFRVEEIA